MGPLENNRTQCTLRTQYVDQNNSVTIKNGTVKLAFSGREIRVVVAEHSRPNAEHRMQLLFPIQLQTSWKQGQKAQFHCMDEISYRIEKEFGEKFSCYHTYQEGCCLEE